MAQENMTDGKDGIRQSVLNDMNEILHFHLSNALDAAKDYKNELISEPDSCSLWVSAVLNNAARMAVICIKALGVDLQSGSAAIELALTNTFQSHLKHYLDELSQKD